MKAFLWTLVALYTLNNVAILWLTARGEMPQRAPARLAVGAIFRAVMLGWAIWLLAGMTA